MKILKTLRVRIALWIALLVLTILAMFGVFIYLTLRSYLLKEVDNSLNLSASQTAALLNVDHGKIVLSEPLVLDETGSQIFSKNGLTLIVMAKDGTVLQAVGPYSSSTTQLHDSDQNGSYNTGPAHGDGVSLRTFTLPVMDNNHLVGWVQSIQSLSGVEETLRRLQTSLLLGGAILSILAGFSGYFLSRRALAPMDNITRMAQRISTEDLTTRLNQPDNGDEVSRLAATFDKMLARLENGFKRERQFTADASHELRTPLTAMQTILSVIRQKQRKPEEYKQALDDLADETERLQALTSSLLELALRESQPNKTDEAVDLSVLLHDLSHSLGPQAEAKGLTIHYGGAEGLTLCGDSDGLIRMFANLILNAIEYTENGKITITAGREDHNDLWVSVADTGFGISAEHRPRIFERFYRADQSRSSRGAGLGLAIAMEIARAHGGNIEFTSEIGKGSVFTVRLPSLQ